jgi:hypothetical protein
MIVAGNHIYERCGYCRKLVRMTGWFAGVHICLTEEDRAMVDAERMRNQPRTYAVEHFSRNQRADRTDHVGIKR